MVASWIPTIREYLQVAQSRRQPTTWVEDLISKLLDLTHHMWTTRNGILHEKDQDSLTALESQQLREDIEEQFLLEAETLKPNDKHLLEGSPEMLQQASLTTKRNWLRAVHLAREIAAE